MCFASGHGDALVEEVHGESADFVVVEVEDEVLIWCAEGAQDREFGVFFVADLSDCFEVVLWYGEDHAFLCFADPDFVVAEAGVLERCVFEVDCCAEFFAHFADGAAESACAAVCDGVVEAAGFVVSCAEDCVECSFFFDGVADLYGVCELVCVCVCEFCA